MEGVQVKENHVVVDRELLTRLVDDAERLERGVEQLVDALTAIATEPTTAPAPAVDRKAAEPRVWNTSDDALSEYDAEQLVALRADHRADKHEAAGCHVCDVLVRRLGSL